MKRTMLLGIIASTVLLAASEQTHSQVIIYEVPPVAGDPNDWIIPVATFGDILGNVKPGIRVRPHEFARGTVMRVTTLVFQEHTGAFGVSSEKLRPIRNAQEIEPTYTADVSAIGDSRFEDGPAFVCYEFEAKRRGRVVFRWRGCATVFLQSAVVTLKGPLKGRLIFDNGGSGFAIYLGVGRLNLMGRVLTYGEFRFEAGEDEGTLQATGAMAFLSEDGEFLVSNVKWFIDADGKGDLEFRWPGEVTFSNGLTVVSTGRFVELPFGGLRGKSTGLNSVLPPTELFLDVRMTGEIVDPDPL